MQDREELERTIAARTAELRALAEELRREIEDRARADALARRHLRALRALTECNEAMIRATDEPTLLQGVCRTIVDVGGYRLCWVGLREDDERSTVRAVAQTGLDDGYVALASVVWADTDRGRGPMGTAIRTGEPVTVRDVLADPSFAPWRDEAVRRGFRSVIALPLVSEGAVLGAIGIYAVEAGAFDDPAEVRLLVDLANDLAFGLGALRARAERASMAARAVEADRLAAVGTLAAGVAHEINNPLACAVSGVDFLERELGAAPAAAPPEELRQVVAEVRDALERIRRIVGVLRTFSRGDDERRVPIDVREVLRSSMTLAAGALRDRARVEWELGDVPPVLADEARLAQVFVNLLVNAAQAIPDGDPAGNEIRLSTWTDGEGRAVVEVRDTGVGIATGALEHVFEPFFTTKPVGVGTGIGLTICRNVVVSLGGEIVASSEPGAGAAFRVVLPPA